jgi:hypothetical protein
LSYFYGEIARVRAALRVTESIAHVDTMRAFDLGLGAGFGIAVYANCRDPMGEGWPDSACEEAMEEFRSALIRAAEKTL